MALRFFMDEQVPKAITVGLRAQGIDVITALEDGSDGLDDAPLLQRAAALERVLFTRDKDRRLLAKTGTFLRRNRLCPSGTRRNRQLCRGLAPDGQHHGSGGNAQRGQASTSIT
jgi:hypothetical protein